MIITRLVGGSQGYPEGLHAMALRMFLPKINVLPLKRPFWRETSIFLCTQNVPLFLWANFSLLSTRWREKASNSWPKTQPKLFPPTCQLWKGKYHSVTLGSRVMVTPTLAPETQRSPWSPERGVKPSGFVDFQLFWNGERHGKKKLVKF